MMFLRRKATFTSTLVVRRTMSVATSESADILRIPVSPSEQSSCKLSGIIVLKYVSGITLRSRLARPTPIRFPRADETTRHAAELFNKHGLIYFDRIMSLDWVRHHDSCSPARLRRRTSALCRNTSMRPSHEAILAAEKLRFCAC
jgi:hypothetical protein